MTEMSMLWTTNGTGHGAAPYTQAEANEFFRDFSASDSTLMGPLFGIDNSLAVSGTASPLSVATGKGIVYGFRYWNNATKNLVVGTPSGDTGGRVVLQADWATQMVLAVVRLNTNGNPAIPTLVQTASTTWEVSLATFVIDNAGNIWTDSSKTVAGVLDTRRYVGQSDKEYFIPATIADDAGGNNIINFSNTGWILDAGVNEEAYGWGQVPSDFIRIISLKAVIRTTGAGDIRASNYISYGACGDATLSSALRAAGTIAITADATQCIAEIDVDDLSPNDIIALDFFRNGVHATDTYASSIFVLGWVLAYEGHA